MEIEDVRLEVATLLNLEAVYVVEVRGSGPWILALGARLVTAINQPSIPKP